MTRVTPEDGRRALAAGEIDALAIIPQRYGEPLKIVGSDRHPSAATVMRAVIFQAAESAAPPIDVTDIDGHQVAEAIRTGIPFTLILAFGFLAIYATAAPLIQQRQRGTLKLLGLTPLSRLTFVLAQLPARLAIAVVQLAVLSGLAYASHLLTLDRLPGAVFSAFITLLLLFAFGYLVGGLASSAEIASAAFTGLLPVLLMPSGFMFPVDTLPNWVQVVGRFVPLSYCGDALRHFMTGAPIAYSLVADYSITVACVIVVTWLAAKTFRWDQGEVG